ncbi:MAG TPA: molecular chaperone TorD family protein [Terriglobales bacterium]|jgi:nitrate reductase delta subunit
MPAFAAYAEALDYPAGGAPPAPAAESPVVRELVEQYAAAAAELTPGRLEEIYAATFDLQPECTLNLSHHLFSDDEWKRSAMLIELKALFQRHALDTAGELPDHLCWLLRLMAAAPEGDAELREVRTRLMLPALRQLQERVRELRNPYPPLLQALYLELSSEADA